MLFGSFCNKLKEKFTCWKVPHSQAIEDVDEFVSSSEQILIILHRIICSPMDALHYLSMHFLQWKRPEIHSDLFRTVFVCKQCKSSFPKSDKTALVFTGEINVFAHILARSNSLNQNVLLLLIFYLQTHSFSLHKVIDGLEWCGLLVDYCDVFISCLDSHSDGTHSQQSIHSLRQWCNATFLQIWWSNKLIYILDGLNYGSANWINSNKFHK